MVADMPHSEDLGPTGKRRFRLQRRLFGRPLVVLEVECAVRSVTRDCGRGSRELMRWNYWRDARAEDLIKGEAA